MPSLSLSLVWPLSIICSQFEWLTNGALCGFLRQVITSNASHRLVAQGFVVRVLENGDTKKVGVSMLTRIKDCQRTVEQVVIQS